MGLWRTAINLCKSGGRIVTYPIAHPQRALSMGGKGLKTAAVGGTAGYVGWEALVNDQPAAKTLANLAVGEEAASQLGQTAHAALDTVNSAAETVSNVASSASQGIASLTGMLTGTGDGEGKTGGLFSGIGNFFSAFTSGQGGNLFGEFFKNIGQGKVSLMSILGLVGAGWLVFGRFGWLGKIFGAILGMSILGGNVSLGNVLGQEKSQTSTPSVAEGIQQVNNPENQTAVIRRGR